MDRTAWIAVALCIIGLVLWEIYSFRQIQPRPVIGPPSQTPPALSGQTTPAAAVAPSPAVGVATPAPAQPTSSATPAFAEVTETLRNSDLELHLTNRGGGIAKAVLLNHVGEQDSRVT